jgi:hypothetical protein
MAVSPLRLDCVAADVVKTHDLKREWAKRFRRRFIDVAHDVAFAVAARAWALAAHLFEADESFGAVIPFDGEFGADDVDVSWSHARKPPEGGTTCGQNDIASPECK